MLIAIDYDRTYAAAPELWAQFIAMAQARGDQVVICTGRAFPPSEQLPVEVHCTAGQAKAAYLLERGLRPDIWIDDDPWSIVSDDPSLN